MKPAQRMTELPPYPFARWSKRVAGARDCGRDIIRLDIGDPDLPPPVAVIEAMTAAAHRPDNHGYPGYRGLPALRTAIADYYRRRFDVALDPDSQVVPLMGSKEGIVNLALAWLNPGDVVLVPGLGYAPYRAGAAFAGAEVYFLPLRPETGFRPDLEAIPAAIRERATMLWLNFPNNPTGATVDLAYLAQAVDFCRQHQILLCHDAPYCEVTYDGYVAPSILQVPGADEVAIEFNSLSKSWNMAGWRVGMAVGNATAAAALAQAKSNMDSGIFRPLQEAAVTALDTPATWLAERNKIYQQRLDMVLAGLQAAGLAAPRPRATLYVWTPVPEGDGETFAGALLDATGVSLAPGSFFGPAGERHLRISVTAPTERIEQAMERLINFTQA